MATQKIKEEELPLKLPIPKYKIGEKVMAKIEVAHRESGRTFNIDVPLYVVGTELITSPGGDKYSYIYYLCEDITDYRRVIFTTADEKDMYIET